MRLQLHALEFEGHATFWQHVDHVRRRFNMVLVDVVTEEAGAWGHVIDLRLHTSASPTYHAPLEIPGLPRLEEAFYNDGFIVQAEDGRYVVVDFTDCGDLAYALQGDERCVAAYVTMYDAARVGRGPCPWKARPFLYFDMHPRWTRELREEIAEIRAGPRDPRLFFSGTIGRECNYGPDAPRGEWRATARVIQERYAEEAVVLDRFQKPHRDEWWRRAAGHAWNLILPGHPWCNREHELWSLGIATIGPLYYHPIMVPVLPGVHYLAASMPAGQDNFGRPRDPEQAADAVMALHRQIVTDRPLADRIGRAAQRRMDEEASVWRAGVQLAAELFDVLA